MSFTFIFNIFEMFAIVLKYTVVCICSLVNIGTLESCQIWTHMNGNNVCVYCSDCNVHAWQTLIKMEHVYKIQPDLICICPLLARCLHPLYATHMRALKSVHIQYPHHIPTKRCTCNSYAVYIYIKYSLQEYSFSEKTTSQAKYLMCLLYLDVFSNRFFFKYISLNKYWFWGPTQRYSFIKFRDHRKKLFTRWFRGE